jgi:transposase InsO family protein
MADFTYVWTAEDWLCVAAVIDLLSRAMSDQMTSQRVTDDLIMTL